MHILRYLELFIKRGGYLYSVKPLYLENGFAHAAFRVTARKVLGLHFFIQVVTLWAAKREIDIKAIKLECFGHVQIKSELWCI